MRLVEYGEDKEENLKIDPILSSPTEKTRDSATPTPRKYTQHIFSTNQKIFSILYLDIYNMYIII